MKRLACQFQKHLIQRCQRAKRASSKAGHIIRRTIMQGGRAAGGFEYSSQPRSVAVKRSKYRETQHAYVYYISNATYIDTYTRHDIMLFMLWSVINYRMWHAGVRASLKIWCLIGASYAEARMAVRPKPFLLRYNPMSLHSYIYIYIFTYTGSRLSRQIIQAKETAIRAATAKRHATSYATCGRWPATYGHSNGQLLGRVDG